MKWIRYSTLIPVLIGCFGGGAVAAEVVSSASNGFSIRVTREVAAAPTKVFQAFLDVGKWWSSAHSFSGDSKNLSIEAKPQGCFCETLPRGGGVAHMTVTYIDPGKRLRMSGGLGPFLELGVAGAMTVTVSEAAGGTKLELVYNVSGYLPQGLDKLAGPASSVLEEQITRLKNYIESGNPTAGQ